MESGRANDVVIILASYVHLHTAKGKKFGAPLVVFENSSFVNLHLDVCVCVLVIRRTATKNKNLNMSSCRTQYNISANVGGAQYYSTIVAAGALKNAPGSV